MFYASKEKWKQIMWICVITRRFKKKLERDALFFLSKKEKTTTTKICNEKYLNTINCGNAWVMIFIKRNDLWPLCELCVHAKQIRSFVTVTPPYRISTCIFNDYYSSNCPFKFKWKWIRPNLISSECLVRNPSKMDMNIAKQCKYKTKHFSIVNRSESIYQIVSFTTFVLYIWAYGHMSRDWYFDLFVHMLACVYCGFVHLFVLWSVDHRCFGILRLIARHFRLTKTLTRVNISFNFVIDKKQHSSFDSIYQV